MAVLTELDVAAIKTLLLLKMSQREIAKLYEVTQGCIAHISAGHTWKNVKAG